MKQRIRHAGFAMLEVLLAVVVMAMASAGGYFLFKSGSDQTLMTQMTSQLSQIASAYSSLASANLTGSIEDEQAVLNLLYNSGQLSKNYFSGDVGNYRLKSPYGTISITAPSAVGFTLSFYFGSDKTADQAKALYDSVQNSYDCNLGCDGESYSDQIKLVLDLTK